MRRKLRTCLIFPETSFHFLPRSSTFLILTISAQSPMVLYDGGKAAPKSENENENENENEALSRKRKWREIEIEVNQKRFECAPLGENLLNYSSDLREAFEQTAWEWDVLDYVLRLTAIPRAAEPPPAPPAQLSLPPRPKDVACVACTEVCHPSEAITAPCGHAYCDECLANLFQSSMTDETLYPPRCCKQPIPIIGKYLQSTKLSHRSNW